MPLFFSIFHRRFLNCMNMSVDCAKGVSLKSVVEFLEFFAPVSLAEKWDNTGLLIEPTSPKLLKCVLLTNDMTEDVVEEAFDMQANLIISYHPPIFKPLNKITRNSWKERIIAKCLENQIAVYSPHTSWDSVCGGVNDWLCKAFDFKIVKPIVPSTAENSSLIGAGRYCELKKEIKISDAIQSVKELTGLKFLNVALATGTSLDSPIKSIAICAGSGSSVLMNAKADLFLTGEMSHHSLLDTIHNKTSVILCNHSNSERGFLKDFSQKLEVQFSEMGLKVHLSKKDKDPIEVF